MSQPQIFLLVKQATSAANTSCLGLLWKLTNISKSKAICLLLLDKIFLWTKSHFRNFNSEQVKISTLAYCMRVEEMAIAEG